MIDDNVIRSIFATDSSEAGDLLDPHMLVYVGLLGALPSFAVTRVRLLQARVRARLAYLGGTALVFGLSLAAASGSWFWFDRSYNFV